MKNYRNPFLHSTWTGSDIDLKTLKQILLKNQHHLSIIDLIKKYYQNAINKANTGIVSADRPNIVTRYFKLPFMGMYSKVTQNKIENHCKTFCTNAKVKLVFTSDKLRQTFTYKDSYPSVLSSKGVYKFVCASINANCVCQRTKIPQSGLMNTLVKIKSHIYTKPQCHQLIL